MRTIAHISDLHFGAIDPRLVSALRATLVALAPDVVAVSGDLTQRARPGQFRDAARFLGALPFPRVVVPGNHDVPLYDVFSRFLNPRGRFRRHITANRFPRYRDSELAVFGADTTRSFTIKDGGLRPSAVRELTRLMAACPPGVLKVVVCHHPLDRPTRGLRWTLPAPDAAAMRTLIERGADVFLTGHLHLSAAGHSATLYPAPHRSAIIVEAGTATSTRARGEGNAFNLLRLDRERLGVDRVTWDPVRQEFASTHTEVFVRSALGWLPPVEVPSAAAVP